VDDDQSEAQGDACGISGGENANDEQASVPVSRGSTTVIGIAPATEVAAVNTCFLCGPLKPGEEVWECTLCLQKFCVNDLEPRRHRCYWGQSS
jgi:hypothetical protein